MINRIPAMPLGRGDVTSPYTVQNEDVVVEFTAKGAVTTKMEDGATTSTTVIAGGRYSLSGVKTITFSGTASIG